MTLTFSLSSNSFVSRWRMELFSDLFSSICSFNLRWTFRRSSSKQQTLFFDASFSRTLFSSCSFCWFNSNSERSRRSSELSTKPESFSICARSFAFSSLPFPTSSRRCDTFLDTFLELFEILGTLPLWRSFRSLFPFSLLSTSPRFVEQSLVTNGQLTLCFSKEELPSDTSSDKRCWFVVFISIFDAIFSSPLSSNVFTSTRQLFRSFAVRVSSTLSCLSCSLFVNISAPWATFKHSPNWVDPFFFAPISVLPASAEMARGICVFPNSLISLLFAEVVSFGFTDFQTKISVISFALVLLMALDLKSVDPVSLLWNVSRTTDISFRVEFIFGFALFKEDLSVDLLETGILLEFESFDFFPVGNGVPVGLLFPCIDWNCKLILNQSHYHTLFFFYTRNKTQLMYS